MKGRLSFYESNKKVTNKDCQACLPHLFLSLEFILQGSLFRIEVHFYASSLRQGYEERKITDRNFYS